MQNLGKQSLRVIKNYTKGYSDTQTKVREATSNDPWGPTGSQMNELATLSYKQQDFIEMMEMLDKRLNDKGKNWRHVWKALTVVDYLLLSGSENCVLYFDENIYIIKTLKEFVYVDEAGKDEGANVRQKAKDITNLLQDKPRLMELRKARGNMQERMSGRAPRDSFGENGEDENAHRRSKGNGSKRQRGGEDDEMRRAIEESKRLHVVEQAKAQEERELAEALKLSEEEEAKRAKSLEEANQRSLFDDQAQQQQQQSTSNNPFPLFDPSAQSQMLQPQFTALAPQFTSFNPYAQQQQQQQQEAMQQQYALQQAEWLRQQQEAQAQAQQQALLQQQQEEWNRQQQQQEEWNRQQQFLAYQQQQQQQQFLQSQQLSPILPQQTSFGSNNPFALVSQGQGMASAPSLSNTTSSSLDNFSLPSTFANSSSSVSSPAPQSPPPPSISAPPVSRPAKDDGQHAHLASLIGNRDDGIDTFGNFGALRYGHGNSGRIVGQQTGLNPFAQQKQQQNQDQPFFSV